MKRIRKVLVSLMVGTMILGVDVPSFAVTNQKSSQGNVNATQMKKSPSSPKNAIKATPKNTVVKSNKVIVKGHAVTTSQVNKAIKKVSKTKKSVNVKAIDGSYVAIPGDLLFAAFIFGIGYACIYLSHNKYVVKVGGKLVRAGSSVYKKVIHYFAARDKKNFGHKTTKSKMTRKRHQNGESRRIKEQNKGQYRSKHGSKKSKKR